MADFERQRLDLARAQRHLEAAQLGALLTRRTIEELEASGVSSADARRKLERLQGVIATMSGYQRTVLRSVDAPDAARLLPPAATPDDFAAAPCRNPIPAPSRSAAAAGRPS